MKEVAPKERSGSRLYYGNSMRRVFRPGDVLRVTEVDFSRLRRGDIICFWPHGRKAGVVHRIVRVEPGCVYTQGDNNARMDCRPVTQAETPLLVFGVNRRERFRKIAGGRRGYGIFLVNRLLRRGRKTAGYFLRPLLRLAPLRFLGFLLPKMELLRFGRHEMLQIGSREAARRSGGRNWVFRVFWLQLFFSSAMLRKLYPPEMPETSDSDSTGRNSDGSVCCPAGEENCKLTVNEDTIMKMNAPDPEAEVLNPTGINVNLHKLSGRMQYAGLILLIISVFTYFNFLNFSFPPGIRLFFLIISLIFVLYLSVLFLKGAEKNTLNRKQYKGFYQLTIFVCCGYLFAFSFFYFAKYDLFVKLVDFPFWNIGILAFWLLYSGSLQKRRK